VRVPIALLGGWLAVAGVSLVAHASSVSYARLSIGDHAITGTIRLPLDDVDLLLRLDRDLDGRVSAAEIEAARGALSAYLAKHLRVSANGVPLTPALGVLTTWRDAAGFEYLEAGVSVDGGRPLRLVSIRSDCLTELYPGHATQAEIEAGGRTDRVVFRAGATYERRVTDERWTAPAIAAAAGAILAMLWFARRRRGRIALAAALVLAAGAAQADVIMTAAGLNATLKSMERLTGQAAAGSAATRAEAAYQLGVLADRLASLMNDEVQSHGMEQRELIDLALGRTKELGIAIAYNRDKKKFFYDGAAFRRYLDVAPHGAHAANAEFTLLAYQFYQSDGTNLDELLAAADTTKRFLARHPAFKANAELALYLAVDYRDLYRHYRDANDPAAAEKFRWLTRAAYQRIATRYPGTEQAQSARQLLRRFEEETRR
jgi:uncharacterized membrane-anchored protein YhcB (DUF1043 family)